MVLRWTLGSWVDPELLSKITAVGFVAPDLDPMRQMLHRLKVGKEMIIERVVGVYFHPLTMWQCDGILGPAHCRSYRLIVINKYSDLMQ
jgi:hypothetical protein